LFQAQRVANGVDQDALDAAAENSFANGAFENTAEEMGEIAEKFLLGQVDSRFPREKEKRLEGSKVIQQDQAPRSNKLQSKLEQQPDS
jgi:hypothetical protein